MKGFAKFANFCAEKVYKWVGKSSGKMLLATSMLGISMSSMIQALAVLVNDKYTISQKSFMIPQELGDAVLSIICIFAITKPTQKLASKLIKSGKILPKNLVNYMKENKLIDKRGKADFDLKQEIDNLIKKAETSDNKNPLLDSHKSALQNFEVFEDSASAIATTAAAITSTCFVVPVLRNQVASRYQKKNMAIINNKHENPKPAQNPTFKSNPYMNSTLFKI